MRKIAYMEGLARGLRGHMSYHNLWGDTWLWLFVNQCLFGYKYIHVDDAGVVVNVGNFLFNMDTRIEFGSEDWFRFLSENKSFTFSNNKTSCWFQKEKRHKDKYYWYAYRWNGKSKNTSRIYVGKLEELSPKEISAKVMRLNEISEFTRNEIARRKAQRKGMRTRRRKRI